MTAVIPIRRTRARKHFAKLLRIGRQLDRTNNWWASNDGPLKYDLFTIDIVPFMRAYLAKKHRLVGTKRRFLDVGCTNGKALLELYNMFGGALEYHGTSLSRLKSWSGIQQRTRNGIRFHVAHAEVLDRKFSPRYFDFIRSSLGISQARNISNAVESARKILKKGGLLK